MKLIFEEERLLKGMKILDKKYVIEKIKSLETDDEDLEEIKNNLLSKLNSCSQKQLERAIMDID